MTLIFQRDLKLKVICTASQVNGRCEHLIYTLKAGQDPIATLYNFLAWREGQAATPSLFESSQPSAPYIDGACCLTIADLARSPTLLRYKGRVWASRT
ncbi:MAG: hypothetical protein J7524_15590 [Roseofilum sp. Belize BBD 4]|uniref:COP23 domain-containing protein n=1 Tax=Roseofilum sp. Belize BBD 4 TaxID=2821500 RepID=UPI000E9496B0|nr:hypothetical protein [Roseofilum sp. Belize Diploria]MBP0034570.1 hypothetical protein [Roseofilum sp. Belize BBD 4]HBQ98062.1 hypothetical protein [Cyanobacteria bacterium UBA11691]